MPGHVAVVVALIKHKAPWDSFRYKRGNFAGVAYKAKTGASKLIMRQNQEHSL